MKKIVGQQVYQNIGFGKLWFLNHKEINISDANITDSNKEIIKLETVINKAIQELQHLYDKVVSDDLETAEIFEVHQMMLQDEDYIDAIKHLINEEHKSCAYAIKKASKNLEATFLSIDDDYLKARAADIRDISQRLINILFDKKISLPAEDGQYIIVSDDLLPSETLDLDLNRVAGFVMTEGSLNSHAAILARMKEIPTIVQAGIIDDSNENQKAILNSVDGLLYINPDQEIIDRMVQQKELLIETAKKLETLKTVETKTKDGHKISVMANISHSNDLDNVLKKGSEGVGLFRTEFLFINSDDYPTEEEQFIQYKKVLETMNPKPVVIRTMDIGTDKTADYFNLPDEENPALGYRAIRIALDRPEILMTQLRALLRASTFGHLCIMFPMITSVWEIKSLKTYIAKAEKQLKSEGVEIAPYEIGIMIETPAAALISDDLALEVDFFSVGTNDLTQYTLAVDRQNTNVRLYEDPTHKAVLRLIKLASDNIHKHENKWIGICGELAANPDLTDYFIGIGIDELSVSPTYILPLRASILEKDSTKAIQEALKKVK